MARLHSLVLIVTVALASFSCQTNMRKAFDRVQNGMDKHSVLNLVGNPETSERWNGRDRWIYLIPDSKRNLQEQEVHFFQGQVVYKGNPPRPKVSAEEQDRKNANENAALSKRWEAERDERRHLYDQMETELKKSEGAPTSN